ncbi:MULTISPECIES: ATP-binding cassette domain-containing protein [Planococcus]|uniref:ABC transporter ATP-binding protein n=1 Tax=Planococcus faecalis TaxID=1598147 RepID=A0ABN4XUH9_9BACL|nr:MULTISPECIES: ATP-binding cassette domain-containing protein [Planococcus]AQU80750.1 ABC transporter ATP-binding protein [Planococcus faecalis]MDJ0331966.1 ATP-binding cassette domain-containing protein [Planococcus sp. S3-L1]OHX55741.1 ABC transporter ATP-binding protein [Planococcus faecalis]
MKLVIEELNKSFNNKHVLKGINLTINSGQIFGYLGRNGAGKTTSMRILMDVFEADTGSITIDGNTFKPTDYRIGYLPEERGMYSKFKVKDQLIYFAELRGANKKDAEHSMKKWAEEFGIAIYLDQKLETLSKGNQQKVQITQAFICEPDILILDEPFSGLDPVNSKIFQDSLLNYIREDRIIIFSSHQMGYIESFCDDIAIINNGKIVLGGDLNDIRKRMGKGKLRLRFADQDNLSFLSGYDYTLEKQDIILTLQPNETKRSFVEDLFSQGIELTMFMDYLPSLQEIFIEKTGDQNEKA